jgi:hypothetical protein
MSNSAPISPSNIADIDGHHLATPQTLTLERFDVEKCEWTKTHLTLSVEIEEAKSDSGAFRDAFRAKCRDTSSGLTGEWVIKKYMDKAVTTV